jgi:hypothetical protein
MAAQPATIPARAKCPCGFGLPEYPQHQPDCPNRPADVEIDPHVIEETAAHLRTQCNHEWVTIGVVQGPIQQSLACVRACFHCSSFTHHVLRYIGDREDTLEDKIVAKMQGHEVEPGNHNAPSGPKEGPPCEKCAHTEFRPSDKFEDIRTCVKCEHPQLYRKPSTKRPI